MGRMVDYMAMVMMGGMVAITAAWAIYTLWAETLKPLVTALGGGN